MQQNIIKKNCICLSMFISPFLNLCYFT